MGTTREQDRIIALQKQLVIARSALMAIAHGGERNISRAEIALEEMNQIAWNSRPTPLKNLIGGGS